MEGRRLEHRDVWTCDNAGPHWRKKDGWMAKDENTELFGHVIMLGFTGKEAVRQWADPTIWERQEQVSFEFYTWMNLVS